MTLFGIGLTGATATAATLAFAGIVCGVVVTVATVAAVVHRRRHAWRNACATAHPLSGADVGPVPVELLGTRQAEPADRT